MSAPVTSANVWTALLTAACASHDNALKADKGRLADLIGTRSARTPALPSGSKLSRPTDAMPFLCEKRDGFIAAVGRSAYPRCENRPRWRRHLGRLIVGATAQTARTHRASRAARNPL